LDLAGFVEIAAFFADGVEFVEEQHARLCPDEIEEAPETLRGLAEVAGDDRVIADREPGQGQLVSHAFCKRRLTVAGRSGQESTVARLEPVARRTSARRCSSINSLQNERTLLDK